MSVEMTKQYILLIAKVKRLKSPRHVLRRSQQLQTQKGECACTMRVIWIWQSTNTLTTDSSRASNTSLDFVIL